jgi:hypothetical protein
VEQDKLCEALLVYVKESNTPAEKKEEKKEASTS